MKRTSIKVNNMEFQFSVIPLHERNLNTQVKINGKEVCWIQWDDRDKFVDDIKQILSKYQVSENLINMERNAEPVKTE